MAATTNRVGSVYQQLWIVAGQEPAGEDRLEEDIDRQRGNDCSQRIPRPARPGRAAGAAAWSPARSVPRSWRRRLAAVHRKRPDRRREREAIPDPAHGQCRRATRQTGTRLAPFLGRCLLITLTPGQDTAVVARNVPRGRRSAGPYSQTSRTPEPARGRREAENKRAVIGRSVRRSVSRPRRSALRSRSPGRRCLLQGGDGGVLFGVLRGDVRSGTRGGRLRVPAAQRDLLDEHRQQRYRDGEQDGPPEHMGDGRGQ